MKRVAWTGELGERWVALHFCGRGYYYLTKFQRLRTGRIVKQRTKLFGYKSALSRFNKEMDLVWTHYGVFVPPQWEKV